LFSEGDSPFLAGVKIEKYLAVAEQKNESVNILANLRNGQPLVAEKNFGDGKVITFLTSVAPVWNNWGKGNPSFVVVMLELAASLAGKKRQTDQLLVGNSIPLSVDSAIFELKVEIITPPREGVAEGSVAKIDLINNENGIAKGQCSPPQTKITNITKPKLTLQKIWQNITHHYKTTATKKSRPAKILNQKMPFSGIIRLV
jgi:hypothetical protein